jgi:hypothetical protein
MERASHRVARWRYRPDSHNDPKMLSIHLPVDMGEYRHRFTKVRIPRTSILRTAQIHPVSDGRIVCEVQASFNHVCRRNSTPRKSKSKKFIAVLRRMEARRIIVRRTHHISTSRATLGHHLALKPLSLSRSSPLVPSLFLQIVSCVQLQQQAPCKPVDSRAI